MSDWQPAFGCIGSRLVLARGEGDLHVLVHQHPGLSVWLLTCLDAGIDLLELEAQEEAAARIEAIQVEGGATRASTRCSSRSRRPASTCCSSTATATSCARSW